jgi:osmotically-inducible protein OsmY
VYLNGTVDTYFDKYEAGDVASTVNGVVDVDNNLTVSKASVPYVFDYEYGFYFPYGHNYNYGYSPVKTDWEIKSDIEDQIYWSPNVNSSDVDVKVNNGIANLKGTVDTWSEYYHAEKNAYEGGALSVDNDLHIALLHEDID